MARLSAQLVARWHMYGIRLAIERSHVRFPVGARMRNDSGQIVHAHVSRHRHSSLNTPLANNPVHHMVFTAGCTTTTMQMSPAKRRLSGPARTLMTSLG